MTSSPSERTFSIVIPMFNREHEIVRCLQSVVTQTFTDFEVLVVDDASQDGSVREAATIRDARIRILRHPVNRGVCPARNTGTREAVGEWLVFLDSDDEFSDAQALERIHDAVSELSADVEAATFRCVMDDGTVVPPNIESPVEMDYDAYVRFLGSTTDRNRDMLHLVRRQNALVMPFPDSRMGEQKYHLDYSLKYKKTFFPAVVRLYHQDAVNRLTDRKTTSSQKAEQFLDKAVGMEAMLTEHGAALRKFAPNVYRHTLKRTIAQSLLANRWRPSVQNALLLMKASPLSIRSWLLLVVSLAGPRTFRFVWASRNSLLSR